MQLLYCGESLTGKKKQNFTLIKSNMIDIFVYTYVTLIHPYKVLIKNATKQADHIVKNASNI